MFEKDEIWKDVHGYEGFYKISNRGRVKSLKRTFTRNDGVVVNRKERIMSPSLCGDGYLNVCLRVNNKIKKQYIHRLVAINFLQKPDYANCVNHKNGNKKDNMMSNLEWVNHKENHAHAIAIGLINNMGENSATSKFTNKEANLIRVFYSTNRFSREEIANLLKVKTSTIVNILTNKRYRI